MITLTIDAEHVPDEHERHTGEKDLALEIAHQIEDGKLGQHYDLSADTVEITVETSD